MHRLELLSLGSAVCITSGGNICVGTQVTNAAVSRGAKANTAACMWTLATFTQVMTFGLGGGNTIICLLSHRCHPLMEFHQGLRVLPGVLAQGLHEPRIMVKIK